MSAISVLKDNLKAFTVKLLNQQNVSVKSRVDGAPAPSAPRPAANLEGYIVPQNFLKGGGIPAGMSWQTRKFAPLFRKF